MNPIVVLDDSDDDSDDEQHPIVEAPLNRWDKRFQVMLATLVGEDEAAEIVKRMEEIRNRRALPPRAFDAPNTELYRFCVHNLPDPFKRQPKCMASMLETLEYVDELCTAKYDAVRDKVQQASLALDCVEMARLVNEAHVETQGIETLRKAITDAARADTEATIGFATERKRNPDVDAFLAVPSYDTLAKAMWTMFRRVDAEQKRKRQHLQTFLDDATSDEEAPAGGKRARTDDESSSSDSAAPKLLRPRREALWIRDCGKEWFGRCQCCGKSIECTDTWHGAHVIARSRGGSNHLDNLRVACGKCNNDMGTMHFDEFRERMGFGSIARAN